MVHLHVENPFGEHMQRSQRASARHLRACPQTSSLFATFARIGRIADPHDVNSTGLRGTICRTSPGKHFERNTSAMLTRLSALSLGFVVTTLLPVAASAADGACHSDDDCGAGEVCYRQGSATRCVDGGVDEADCQSSAQMTEGVCRPGAAGPDGGDPEGGGGLTNSLGAGRSDDEASAGAEGDESDDGCAVRSPGPSSPGAAVGLVGLCMLAFARRRFPAQRSLGSSRRRSS